MLAAGRPGQGEARGRPSRLRKLLSRPRTWAVVLLLGVAAGALAVAWPSLQAGFHRRAARADLECYHNPQAVRHLQICLRLWPHDPEVLLLSARAARRAGVYPDADRSLEEYQKLRGLDEACSLEQLLLAAERNVESVAGTCRRYVEQDRPEAPLILEALVRGYLRQYRQTEARFCLDQWLKRQPDNAQAYCLKGQIYLDYEPSQSAALDNYRRAVQLDPEHEEARLGLAIAELQVKHFAEAAEQLEFVRQRQPENLRVLVGLAECHAATDRQAQADRLLDEVLARAPTYAPALSLRGRLALEREHYADAETWLRQALAGDPANHQARYNLILALRSNGKEEEARRHKERLAQMEQDVKRFNEIVTQEIARRPHDPALHCKLGQLLLRSGHRNEGLRWLQNALRQDPQYGPARQALAAAYQKAKTP